jgi:hypothetical protein
MRNATVTMFAAAMLLSLSSLAQATVVNVDFGLGTLYSSKEGAYVTGDAKFWNNGGSGGGTLSNLTASDSSTVTTWDVTTTVWGTVDGASATNALIGDFIYSYLPGNATTGRLTISGLTPGDSYQIYMYNSMAGQGERFILGTDSSFVGGTQQNVSGRPNATTPSDVTGANPVYTLGTDYTVFNLTADGSGNIYGRFLGPTDSDGGHFSGIQIVSVPVPEPSAIILLSFGLIGFISKARRFRTV